MLTLSDNDWTRDYEAVLTLRDVHEAYGLDLGLRDYPIFDENYREHLNQRIYDHFVYRRIAADTPQLFVFYLNRLMRENMPAYNAIYKALLKQDFDPFDTTVTDAGGHTKGKSDSASNTTQSSTGNTTGSSESTSTSILSDTPATFMNDPTEPRYMSQLTQNKSTGSNKGTSKNDATDSTTSRSNSLSDYINHLKGRSGYFGSNVTNMLTSGFMNTDRMVCEMLEPCFIQLWTDEPY